MPDQPPPKRLPFSQPADLDKALRIPRLEGALPDKSGTGARGSVTSRRVRYAELHCKTNFSFLEGASHPDELAVRAAELGYEALAVTDVNSLAGVVRAHVAAKQLGLKLLVGAEVRPIDAPAAVLLAADRASYGRLSRLLTRGRRNAPKGECRLTFDDVAEHAEGLIALVMGMAPGVTTGPTVNGRLGYAGHYGERRPNGVSVRMCSEKRHHDIVGYRDAFADRCYALAELHRGPDDRRVLSKRVRAAKRAGVPLAAANDVHYHVPQRRDLHDVLAAVRHGCTVAQLGERMFSNNERFLKSPEEMAALFADCPDAVRRTIELAERCRFSLDELRYEYPEELSPPGTMPLEYLKQLTWQGARERYPHGIPDKVRGLIEHELALIEELRYEAYFLTVQDLVQFARSRDILCQGRGSAANSVVCYCLGVTSVDPERIDVLFERFVSKERNEAPDIDVDFEHERREEVLQYVYEKYGRDRAGMTAEVITYRPRSAVRDVGKALGLSLDRVDTLAKALENYSEDEKLARRFREAGLEPASSIGRKLISLVREILGFPRHLSQHVGGMVITQGLLCELVPIENASMPDRTVVEWDKDDLDALGILKVDCLALGMLTAIRKGFQLVEKHCQRPLTLASVPAEDPVVYEMIQRADTIGVFQIESRAQMSMLPRLRPESYYDLVIEVAIVRPGPIQGDMVHPYLRRRRGDERVEYPNDRIREVLHKTLGVPIFQEQAMRLAIVAAGFTPGEADQLRRAMGAWRKRGVIDAFRQRLVDGMLANGYSADFAERVFKQIRGFGEYGFPESHAASFALLVYVSSWLKRYYPAAFTAALLNSQPMGFYAPAQLVADARRHDIEVRPVDVNASDWNCTLEEISRLAAGGHRPARAVGPASVDSALNVDTEIKSGGSRPPLASFPHSALALRLGMRLLKGLSQVHADRIVACRNQDGPFRSFDDLLHKTQLPSAVLARLARGDAFGSLGLSRRAALWESLPVQMTLPLFEDVPCEEPPVELPAMSPQAEVTADYHTAGLSLRAHPMTFIRAKLERMRVVEARALATLPVNRYLKVAGVVLLRQRPGSARGITFVTLEDETGLANLIIKPEVWERYHRVARTAAAMIAHGRLQREGQIIHVLVTKLENLSSLLADHHMHSRDFQ